jgi:plasmid stabilization system protein ParE
MAKFRLARAAERDLQEIKDYIAHDSVAAAAGVLDRLEQAFLELAEMPGLGHVERISLRKASASGWSTTTSSSTSLTRARSE